MLQSIRLMAMPALELQEQIRMELETNPALEILEDRSELSLESVSEGAGENRDDDPFENASDPGRATTAIPDDEDPNRMFLEGAISRPETLQQHLLDQLGLLRLSADLRALCERLIQNLDDNGFHTVPPGDLCPDCPPDLIRQALDLIRPLDPVGTCTTGYRESLLVQARLDPAAPQAAIALLADHVDLFETGKLQDLRRALRLSEADFRAVLDYLGALNPFPGRAFSSEAPQFIMPDLAIRIEDGEFVIILNDDIIPVLGINPFFSELAAAAKPAGHTGPPGPAGPAGSAPKPNGQAARERESIAFARDNVDRAKFFIGSIRQRNATLLKVAKAIVRYQRDFFLEGPRALTPLTLRDIADEIGVHETTISRAVNGKYIQTERGIVEMRRFFTNSISGSGSRGSDHSKEGVKARIREILAENHSATTGGPSSKSISDREISELLARRGIRIARRTVAKYRGEIERDNTLGRGTI